MTLFIVAVFMTPAAFAADGAVSRVLPTSVTNAATANTGDGSARTVTTTTRTAPMTAVTSAASTSDDDATTARSGASAARTAVSRTVVVSEASNTTKNNGSSASRDVVSTARSAGTSRALAVQGGNEKSARETLNETVSNVGMSSRASAASINANSALRRAGVTVRPSTADYGGRAKIAGTDQYTGTNIDFGGTKTERSVTARAATTINAEAIAAAKERLEQTAELNKSCQEQYNECMDQFCSVIDSNQKRCSCSANLSRYTKVEDAVKSANTKLNEVAQRIRYVGLSADEIRAILTATEAEEALSGQRDTTESRNMLEKIEDMIKDPTTNTAYGTDTYSGLDLDLDFTAGDLDDIFSLDFLTNTTGSFSNLRGRELYNAAKKRCNTVLTQCKGAGATPQQITGNYDLAIDKDCIAYEQGLNKMNETLVSNVRSAERMLQKARLAVLQNKNQYDAKGCVAALETCMADDMVCGDDFFKCVDPTKIYIDENGEVVLGKNVTNIRKYMETYSNAAITEPLLRAAHGMSINDITCKAEVTQNDLAVKAGNNGACNIKYLLSKIGTKQKAVDEGLCRPVLDKCQRYTYDANGNYKMYNDIVINYIQRAMVNIRAAQEQVISDYASTCMVDIATCYNQQVTQVNAWSSNASINSILSVMRGACRNVALTCAYAIFDREVESGDPWPTCSQNSKTCNFICTEDKQSNCIELISEMFYQSLLCPDNSTYDPTPLPIDPNKTPQGAVNDHCRCRDGYETFGGQCLPVCGDGASRNTYGTCVCEKDGDKMSPSGSCYTPE